MSVIKIMAEERKRADEQRMELIKQNSVLINLLKKGYPPLGDTAEGA
jgi:hypothetical protein